MNDRRVREGRPCPNPRLSFCFPLHTTASPPAHFPACGISGPSWLVGASTECPSINASETVPAVWVPWVVKSSPDPATATDCFPNSSHRAMPTTPSAQDGERRAHAPAPWERAESLLRAQPGGGADAAAAAAAAAQHLCGPAGQVLRARGPGHVRARSCIVYWPSRGRGCRYSR